MNLNRFVGFICLFSIFFVRPAVAAEYLPEDWQFTLVPYLWALSVDGDMTIKGSQYEVDMGFDDVWDHLNVAVMAHIEARKGRVGVFVSPFFSRLEEETDLADITNDLYMVSFGASYRLGPWNLTRGAESSSKTLVVDLFAGGRYTYVNFELDGNLLGNHDDKGHKDWLDPIIGLRSFLVLSPKWTLNSSGDVGGFGVGSDFAWHASAAVGYKLKFLGDDDAQIFAGYRILSQDYKTGSGDNEFAWDIDLKGPTIGLAYHF